MKYWLITYDFGYGKEDEVVQAETHQEALDIAYQAWRDGAESNADYGAEEATPELLDEYCYDPADYGLEPVDEPEGEAQ